MQTRWELTAFLRNHFSFLKKANNYLETCMIGSLTGRVSSEKVSEVYKGRLKQLIKSPCFRV